LNGKTTGMVNARVVIVDRFPGSGFDELRNDQIRKRLTDQPGGPKLFEIQCTHERMLPPTWVDWGKWAKHAAAANRSIRERDAGPYVDAGMLSSTAEAIRTVREHQNFRTF